MSDRKNGACVPEIVFEHSMECPIVGCTAPLVTDEMVERAAGAYFEATYGITANRRAMRAALEEALR